MSKRTRSRSQLGPSERRFNHASRVQGAAALALWPPNADRHAALNALIDELAEADPDAFPAAQISAADWRSWLGGSASRALRSIQPDGVHDSPLAFEVPLCGQPRSLLGGDLEFPDLHYRLWLE